MFRRPEYGHAVLLQLSVRPPTPGPPVRPPWSALAISASPVRWWTPAGRGRHGWAGSQVAKRDRQESLPDWAEEHRGIEQSRGDGLPGDQCRECQWERPGQGCDSYPESGYGDGGERDPAGEFKDGAERRRGSVTAEPKCREHREEEPAEIESERHDDGGRGLGRGIARCESGELRSVASVELGEQLADVCTCCSRTHVEPCGDLVVRMATADLDEGFAFAVGELFERPTVRGGRCRGSHGRGYG